MKHSYTQLPFYAYGISKSDQIGLIIIGLIGIIGLVLLFTNPVFNKNTATGYTNQHSIQLTKQFSAATLNAEKTALKNSLTIPSITAISTHDLENTKM